MIEVLKEVKFFLEKEEIFIGCVIVKDGYIIGRGYNVCEEFNKVILYVEIMVINNVNEKVGNWCLLDIILFVIVEFCVMCSGVIGLVRIFYVIYGVKNMKFGVVGSFYDILSDS